MKVISSFLFCFCFLLLSCNKNEQITEPNIDHQYLSINNDKNDLKSRLKFINEEINFSKSSQDLNYTLVANIEPETMNGYKLSTTSLTADNEHAYVCFHTRGEMIGGEILTIDVSIPENPQILQSARSEIMDFNDIHISANNDKLWICGDQKFGNSGGAFAMELPLDKNFIPVQNESWIKELDAYSGNSITSTSKNNADYLWITSGSNGGLNVYEQENPENLLYSFKENNTKHFAAGRDYGVVLFGRNENLSIIRVFNLNSNFEYIDYNIPYDITKLGKNGLFVDRNMAYLAMGDDGLIAFDLQTGQIANIFKAPKKETANSVFVEKDFIYLAYGFAGLYILDKSSMQSLGNWKYEGSCNFVHVVHETIFVANGNGDGFLVLTKN